MRKLRSILLIDDNETSNFLNDRLLKRMNLTDKIQVLNNAQEALDYLVGLSKAPANDIKPEVILLDINMPVLDGFEFLALYQELPATFREDILIALLSTSNHPKDTERAREFNVHYITKPLTTDKVAALIAK